MKKLLTLVSFVLLVNVSSSQILLNGDFTFGTLFWSCSPETNPDSFYGGSSGNTVAEVDAAAGLCQTISGLTPGHLYALSFNASRRTGTCPAPAITNVNVTISGGALSAVATLTNTTFGYSTVVFIFAATSNNHTLTFSAGSDFGGSTCGMIIDNISVSSTALPIELVSFKGNIENNSINLLWTTVSERNNNHFEIERSSDGISFTKILTAPSKAHLGNSSTRLDYETSDSEPLSAVNYYRLKQTDNDGTFTLSQIIAVEFEQQGKNEVMLYPNPNNGEFILKFSEAERTGDVRVILFGSLGTQISSNTYTVDKNSGILKISVPEKLNPGNYNCVVLSGGHSRNIPLFVEK